MRWSINLSKLNWYVAENEGADYAKAAAVEKPDEKQVAMAVAKVTGKLPAILAKINPSVIVKPVAGFETGCKPECPDYKSLTGGYRYRVPVAGKVEIKSNTETLATSRVPIAQFGPIAVLPARINGTLGKIVLETHPQTGGVQKVTLGATPLPSDTLSNAIGTIADPILAVRAARQSEK
ncbi:MAG: DUF4831 family protein [Rhodospirillaceae bacterium]